MLFGRPRVSEDIAEDGLETAARNGVVWETGELLPPISGVRRALVEEDPQSIRDRANKDQKFRLAVPWVDPTDLSRAGWGVIYGASIDEEVKAALEPLLNLRREQAGKLFVA